MEITIASILKGSTSTLRTAGGSSCQLLVTDKKAVMEITTATTANFTVGSVRQDLLMLYAIAFATR